MKVIHQEVFKGYSRCQGTNDTIHETSLRAQKGSHPCCHPGLCLVH